MAGLCGVGLALATRIRSAIIQLILITGRDIKRARTDYGMRKHEWFTIIFVLILALIAAKAIR